MKETDFTFFERTLHERRSYRGYGGRSSERYAWMREWGADQWVPGAIPDEPVGDLVLAGMHQMRPGNPLGVARVNERFNVTLPTDFDAFYRRWDGGVLLFREIYPLLSVEQMLVINAKCAKVADWDRGSPLRLIRFCSLYNEDYLCLRLGDDGAWMVVFKACEYPDSEYFVHWHELQGTILDRSFSEWLRRMVATDGWPVGGESLYEDDIIPPTERIE